MTETGFIGHIVFDWDGTMARILEDRRYHLFPGIRELLEKLSDFGCGLYLWTARERISMTRILEELSVKSFFLDISTPTDCAPKPSPEGLIRMLDGVDRKKVVVIGDSYSDVIGAKKFGATSIGAGWNPDLNHDVLKEFGVDEIILTPQDCLFKIQDILKG